MPKLASPQHGIDARSEGPAQQSAPHLPRASIGSLSGMPLFLQRAPVNQTASAQLRLPSVESAGEPPPIQPKLAVNLPGDQFEQEADALADLATSSAAGRAGATPPALTAARTDTLHRSASAPAATAAPALAPPDSGAPLTGSLRARMEPLLGRSLGGVRVHESPQARDTANFLGARAFTHRDHIWLGKGESQGDERLLAHEVTHVAQQAGRDTPDIQRTPAAYRHAEDGAEPHRRMRAKLREELGEEAVVPAAPRRADASGGAAPPPVEHEPIDRGEVNAERAQLEPQARPDVDRAAEERPQVEASAEETQAAVDGPPEEGGGKEGKGGTKGTAPKSPAETAIEAPGLAAQQAFAAAEAVNPPVVPPAVQPIPQVAPVDAAGRAIEPVPGADEAVAEIAQATQSMRDEGTGLQEMAAGERRNTNVMQGNMNLVRQGIAQADLGVTSSTEHAEYRGGVVDQARAALDVSREKTAMVAEHAPRMQEKADEGREDSEGVNREAGELNSEASANAPDDEEAAERSREQQGEMNRAGSDISNVDRAFEGSQERSRGLAADAAQAADLNAQADARMQESTAMLERTRDRLGRMRAETDGAIAQVEGLADQPAMIHRQTDALDATGIELVEQSFAVEQRLRAEQEVHQRNSSAIPAVPEGSTADEAMATTETPPPATPAAALPEQLDPEPVAGLGGGPAAARGAASAPSSAPPAEEAAGATPARDEEADGRIPPPIPVAVPGEAVVQRQPQAGYEDRYSVDLASPLAGAIPQLLGGTSGAESVSREEQEQREQARREQEIRDIQIIAGKPFEQLNSWERQKVAVRLALRHLGTSLGNIRFPGWGALAIGLINPITPLLGVVSGLSMIVSGAANIFNIEAWRRDWLGNLLKIAADIATGLTIVLGSITALAAVIAALCTVLIFVTFGALAPALGPVVAFCSSVMVTVGGWTIAVGKFALLFQLLCFIKNLYEAGVARNAAELQRSSDRMSTDISGAGNVVLQMGMAKLAQIGGRQMQASIVRAGGGAAWAGGLNTRVGAAFQSARVGAAGVFGGARAAVAEAYAAGGLAGAARTVGGGVVRGAGWTVAAPFRAGRALYRGLRAPAPELPASPFGRAFLVGKNAGPGMAGARAAALEGRALAEGARAASERAQMQATIEALRTPTGGVDAAARARLLAQLPTVQASTAAQVEELAASMLNVPRQQITSRLVGEAGTVGQQGATGARVYIIFDTPPGGAARPISAVKIFPSTAGQVNEFVSELSALDRLSRVAPIEGQGVVSTQGAARTASGQGVLSMSAAPGQSIDSLLVAFGRGQVSIEVVTTAFRREGEALARLHMATARGAAPSAAATAQMTGELETQFAQLQQRVAASTNPEVQALNAEMGAAQQRVSPLITGVEQNPGASSIVHGDFHPGNVFYDQASGRITFIDASRVHQSIDQAGQGILSPARDVATGRASIEVFASNPEYGVNAAQRRTFQTAFSEGYTNTVVRNGFSQEALAFHQARYAVRRLLDSLEGGSHGLRLQGAMNEFRAAFGLPPVAPPPPPVPTSVP